MSSESFHEPIELLPEATRDMHRALTSLQEELEAVDWYQQRVDAASDAELAALLAHNRDEEIEHAMMVLEWIRRRSPKFDQFARTFLYSEGPLTAVETKLKGADGGGAAPSEGVRREGSLGIGSLRDTRPSRTRAAHPALSVRARSDEPEGKR